MKRVRPGMAGGLLVSAALLIGAAAMWTVADEPVVAAQVNGQNNANAEEGVPTDQVAVTQNGDVEATVANTDGLQGVLRILERGGPVPADVRDPAFDYYVDLSLLGTAWVDLDASLLTDLAFQFLEGERVLHRPHRAVSSQDMVNIAARLATIKNDEASLARLEAAVQEKGDEKLKATLADAKTELAELNLDSLWSIPVATTSAIQFARYKGVLQDIEAAIVVRDVETLQAVQNELQSVDGLPETQASRLSDTITKAIASFPAQDQLASETASVLDKLAHASRDGSRLTIFTSLPTVCTAVPTECNVVPTECPATVTECQMVSTSCPQGSVATQCPATATECPQQQTVCPQYPTICSPQQCVTQQPSSPTQCQTVPTQCPEDCNFVTQQPSAPTVCQLAPTQCSPGQCQQPTQYPSVPTQCQAIPTQCSQQCQQPTQYPSVPTQCQAIPTQCSQQCQQPTQYPSVPTQCQAIPTQCSATQKTKSCDRPTLFPEVPTRCPSILTRCPQSPTYCPSNCGQQQQKQRWVPPSKGKPPGAYQQSPPGAYQQYPPGAYQQSPMGGQSYPDSPYRRRDDYDMGFGGMQ